MVRARMCVCVCVCVSADIVVPFASLTWHQHVIFFIVDVYITARVTIQCEDQANDLLYLHLFLSCFVLHCNHIYTDLIVQLMW